MTMPCWLLCTPLYIIAVILILPACSVNRSEAKEANLCKQSHLIPTRGQATLICTFCIHWSVFVHVIESFKIIDEVFAIMVVHAYSI